MSNNNIKEMVNRLKELSIKAHFQKVNSNFDFTSVIQNDTMYVYESINHLYYYIDKNREKYVNQRIISFSKRQKRFNHLKNKLWNVLNMNGFKQKISQTYRLDNLMLRDIGDITQNPNGMITQKLHSNMIQ